MEEFAGDPVNICLPSALTTTAGCCTVSCNNVDRLYLEPLLDFTVPVADETGWAADDDSLSDRLATKQIIA